MKASKKIPIKTKKPENKENTYLELADNRENFRVPGMFQKCFKAL